MHTRGEKIIGVALLFMVICAIALLSLVTGNLADGLSIFQTLNACVHLVDAIILAFIVSVVPSVVALSLITLIVLMLQYTIPSLRHYLAQRSRLDFFVFSGAIVGCIATLELCTPTQLSLSTFIYVGGFLVSCSFLFVQFIRTVLQPKKKTRYVVFAPYLLVALLLFLIIETNAKIYYNFAVNKTWREQYIQQVKTGTYHRCENVLVATSGPAAILFRYDDLGGDPWMGGCGYLYSETPPDELPHLYWLEITEQMQLDENWWWVKLYMN
ncbi:hypothetical protein [Oceanidesulfovibrio marinus]|uniref:Uncharacterized protein n=1 Tax=Oceanidesulfovibrio marinus TaxID=370038 RepID=A0ABX6NIP0_9BACT|nr:hypothetical protein [Oceanidesulfovibrio marinus]QJT10477.1 hypothetical protein E8L03_16765 [Oceanidesulfovibrio marinus]